MRLFLVLAALCAMPAIGYANINSSDVVANTSNYEIVRKSRVQNAQTYEEFLQWATPEEIVNDLALNDEERNDILNTDTRLDETQVASLTPMAGSAGVLVDVEKASQTMTVTVDGQVMINGDRIRTGRPGYPTPSGRFGVTRTARVTYSTEFGYINKKGKFVGAAMPYSVFFHGGAALHEGLVNVPSHGCIHLSGQDAEFVYNAVQTARAEHAPVIIWVHGNGP